MYVKGGLSYGESIVCANRRGWVLAVNLSTDSSGPKYGEHVTFVEYAFQTWFIGWHERFIRIEGYDGTFPESCFKRQNAKFDKLLKAVAKVPKKRKSTKKLITASL